MANNILLLFKNITVEPTLCLYLLAFMITSIIEKTFYIFKTCKDTLNYNIDTCSNLETNIVIKEIVLNTVSTFYIYNYSIQYCFIILISPIFININKYIGKKYSILLSLFGKILFVLGLIVNSLFEWDVYNITFTCTFPACLFGSDSIIFANSFAYISDITNETNRTFRLTILQVIYITTIPLGIIIGQMVFKIYKSFTLMFYINLTLLLIAFIYTLVHLKNIIAIDDMEVGIKNNSLLIKKIFNYKNVLNLLKFNYYNNKYIILICFCMLFYTSEREESSVLYLYTQLKFNWNFEYYSFFKIFQTTLSIIVLIIFLFVTKYIKIKDEKILIFSNVSFIIGQVIYIFAEKYTTFYTALIFIPFGVLISTILRSILSKITTTEERSSVFIIFCLIENLGCFMFELIFPLLFITYPKGIFYVSILVHAFIFTISLILHKNISNIKKKNPINKDNIPLRNYEEKENTNVTQLCHLYK